MVPRKGKGGRLQRDLPNLGVEPSVEYYQPPPPEECTSETFPIDLSEESRLVVRIFTQNKIIVDFAIMQIVTFEHEFPDVARIDCCGGILHRHQFNHLGRQLVDHQKIADIPINNGQHFVNENYDRSFQVMHDGWERNLRRWRDE